MFVISYGNPFDGVKLYGFFYEEEQAIETAEIYGFDDWNIVQVHSPDDLSL